MIEASHNNTARQKKYYQDKGKALKEQKKERKLLDRKADLTIEAAAGAESESEGDDEVDEEKPEGGDEDAAAAACDFAQHLQERREAGHEGRASRGRL